MQEYKGIYHDVQDKTKSYEFGAHFKYSELCDALINLQIQQQKGIPLTEDKNVNNEKKEGLSLEKNRKKYKLKTYSNNVNNRYINTDINQNSNKKSEFSIIDEEQEIKMEGIKRKKNRFITKSEDKVHLPMISSNILPMILNTESNEPIKLNKSLNLQKKKKNFPKLNSLHKNDILPEAENVETQSRFQDNPAVKIYSSSEEKNHLQYSFKKNKDKIFPKLFKLSKNNEEKLELISKPHRKPDRLKSIFETEKKIKNNNLFLGDKNNYFNKEQRNIMNEHMAQQIHNLKKQLLVNKDKNLKYKYE